MSTVDLLLHPVRLRILQAFLGGQELTTSQLAVEMGDVPAGRIYRHVTLLANAGVLVVTSEHRARGAVERTYSLGLKTTLAPVEASKMSLEEHLKAFAAFVSGLLASYEGYLKSGRPDPVRDGVGYSMNALWLSDDEYSDFLKDVTSIVEPRTKLKQTPGRKRRLVAGVFMPMASNTGGQ